jgi:hypothetical protein
MWHATLLLLLLDKVGLMWRGSDTAGEAVEGWIDMTNMTNTALAPGSCSTPGQCSRCPAAKAAARCMLPR